MAINCETAFSGPNFAAKTPVMVDGTPSSKLFQAPFDDLFTTVMLSHETLIDKHTRALFIMYGGTGGKSHAYGIGASMGGLALKFRGLPGAAVAFQNPLYYMDHLSDAERMSIIHQFTSTESQTGWMARTLEWAIQSVLDGEGKPKIPIYLYTRSSGTLIAGQLSDNYARGIAGSEVFGKLTGWLATGALPHDPVEMQKWLDLEQQHLMDVERNLREDLELRNQALALKGMPPLMKSTVVTDEIVRRVQPETFGPMTWASYQPDARPVLLRGRPHPKVWMFLGAHDPEISLKDQKRVAVAYSHLHPDVDVTAIASASGHNTAGPVTFKNAIGEEVKIKALQIISPYVQNLLSTKDIPQTPGLKLVVDPSLGSHGICASIAAGFQN